MVDVIDKPFVVFPDWARHLKIFLATDDGRTARWPSDAWPTVLRTLYGEKRPPEFSVTPAMRALLEALVAEVEASGETILQPVTLRALRGSNCASCGTAMSPSEETHWIYGAPFCATHSMEVNASLAEFEAEQEAAREQFRYEQLVRDQEDRARRRQQPTQTQSGRGVLGMIVAGVIGHELGRRE